MLKTLSIKNFALIDDLHIEFPSGFIIITGETGAGKSILLDALSLVLGKRADMSALRNAEEKCVVEADFFLENYDFQSLFSELEIDYEHQTIIRREILPSGKSRAFINDTPVTLDVLSRLGQVLVDIHSQHQTLSLGDLSFQFEIIDLMAGNENARKAYLVLLESLKKNQQRLQELIDFQKTSAKEYDYNLHLLKELKSAPLQKGIQQELEEAYEEASNIEEIKEYITESLYLLSDENVGVVNQLRELRRTFSNLTDYKQQYRDIFERIDSAFLELEDLQSEVFEIDENIETDPEKSEEISQNLNLIYNLQKKHKVATVDELIEIQEELERAVAQTENVEDDIKEQKRIVEEEQKATFGKAMELHKTREEVIPTLDEKLTNFMRELGMPNARFSIELTPKEVFQSNGIDELLFLFSANKGGNFGALKKVASGGELSRIMLAVKAIMAEHTTLPTIMFDEIDTGVSGEISQKMGDIMKEMSKKRQVFAITHLPQVASKGESHFKVFKEDINGRTTTQLKLLSEDERISEIAEMLEGKNSGDSARNHAMELLRKG